MNPIRKFVKAHPGIKKAYLACKEEFDYLFRMNEKDKALVRFKRAGGEAIRFRYDIRDEDVVFDLGGYMGDWCAKLPNLNCQVHIFEPVKEFSEICAERFKDRKNIHCHAFGLDAATHTAEISHEADGSSQYHDKGETETAEFVDIEEFMKDEGIGKVKLIKLNIEGGEYDILEKLVRTGDIRRFENIQVQFHDIPEINAKERMENLWKELEKTHVLTWAYRPWIHENWELKKDEQEV
ncbi:MAG: FkbM family methyltransferase [Lachnospiraceae bacterium]|nr:FkbM family methyltransferase [Lachnospiraceae bacterium]